MELANNRFAPSRARSYARDWAAHHQLGAEITGRVELVVSELVSNAVRHADPPYRIDLQHKETAIYGEVTDQSTTLPTPTQPDHNGGYGLKLVGTYALWGVTMHASGKHVWFELPLGE